MKRRAIRLKDGSEATVAPVAAYLRDLQACGRPATTQRSYGMDLLRWFRFLRAAGVDWDQATRTEARDFISWLQVIGKPGRAGGGPGGVNSVTGKPVPGVKYAPATVAHCETVLRSFYEFHLEAGSGPMVNPFPLVRDRRQGRPLAHHNPMQPWRGERSGRYRPKVVQRVPRQIPDEKFGELFAALGSHRDRALVSLWVSSGARVGAARSHLCRRRSGAAADYGDPQGVAGVAAATGIPGRVCLAAVVSGPDAGTGARQAR